MAQELVEMAKDLVMALIQADMLEPEDMQNELHKTHASLLQLKSREDGGESSSIQDVSQATHSVDWKKSIKKHTVACLVCGATFKQLSARHLSIHDLDPRSYRQKFGIPSSQPLSAKETTATRRRVVQAVRPWEKKQASANKTSQAMTNGTAATLKRSRRQTTVRGA